MLKIETSKVPPPKSKMSTLETLSAVVQAVSTPYAKAAAFIWFATQMYVSKHEKQVRRLGFKEKGYALGEALFKKILNSKSGTLISEHLYEESWDLIRHKDKKVHLEIPEMLEWLKELPKNADTDKIDEYPFNLLAGERRSYNANAVLRNPEWRKKDMEGALKINPIDAREHELSNGDWVLCRSKVGAVKIKTWITEEVPPGLLSMPHGYGFNYPGHTEETAGALVNILTASEDCDPLAKTPYHKNVRVKIEKAPAL